MSNYIIIMVVPFRKAKVRTERRVCLNKQSFEMHSGKSFFPVRFILK